MPFDEADKNMAISILKNAYFIIKEIKSEAYKKDEFELLAKIVTILGKIEETINFLEEKINDRPR
ncbi:MAG: hypothetical protein LWW95_11835 [Candidatus Desulfofervidus auxilii]|nr:hypothetical protein [Candidatus Desulfofervidus auxilii]